MALTPTTKRLYSAMVAEDTESIYAFIRKSMVDDILYMLDHYVYCRFGTLPILAADGSIQPALPSHPDYDKDFAIKTWKKVKSMLKIFQKYPRLLCEMNDQRETLIFRIIEKYNASEILLPMIFNLPNAIPFLQQALFLPNIRGNIPLHIATTKCSTEIVFILLKLELSINSLDTQFQASAACLRDLRSLELGINSKITSLSIQNEEGATPLLIASQRQNWELCRSLLAISTESIDIPNKKGITPIFAAARRNLEQVRLFLQFGSQAWDLPNQDGITPLQLAIDTHHSPMTKFLLPICRPTWKIRFDRGIILRYPKFYRMLIGCSDSREIPHTIGNLSETERLRIRHKVYFSYSLMEFLLNFCR